MNSFIELQVIKNVFGQTEKLWKAMSSFIDSILIKPNEKRYIVLN